jgi:hypothetical protein
LLKFLETGMGALEEEPFVEAATGLSPKGLATNASKGMFGLQSRLLLNDGDAPGKMVPGGIERQPHPW